MNWFGHTIEPCVLRSCHLKYMIFRVEHLDKTLSTSPQILMMQRICPTSKDLGVIARCLTALATCFGLSGGSVPQRSFWAKLPGDSRACSLCIDKVVLGALRCKQIFFRALKRQKMTFAPLIAEILAFGGLGCQTLAFSTSRQKLPLALLIVIKRFDLVCFALHCFAFDRISVHCIALHIWASFYVPL